MDEIAESRTRPQRAPDTHTAQTPKRRSSIGRVLLAVVLLGVVGGAGWYWWTHHQSAATARRGAAGGAAQGAPQPVGFATIDKGDIRIILNELGTVTSLDTVTVLTQINGQLQEVGFKEGQMVKKGDFLAQIDPRPYIAALEQAQGTLAQDQGAAGTGADQPEALPDAWPAGLDRAAAGRRPALPGAAVHRDGADRSGCRSTTRS